MKNINNIKIIIYIISMTCLINADSDRIRFALNGHYYQRIDIAMTWHEACVYCQKLGGHLVTITSKEENDFVYRNLGIDGINIWIGATDETEEGTWQWVTGEPFIYSNWATQMPDDYQHGQDYAIFWDLSPQRWDDNGLPECNCRYVFICEWDFFL